MYMGNLPSSQFCCEPKSALKKKKVLKKIFKDTLKMICSPWKDIYEKLQAPENNGHKIKVALKITEKIFMLIMNLNRIKY